MRIVRTLATPVILLLLLGFLLWGAWWGYRNVMAPPLPPKVTPCVTTSVGQKLASWRVTVNVYNGGPTRGAANTVAKQLKTRGFKVQNVANTDQRITTTVIVGRSADDPATKMVQGFFPKSTIKTDPQRGDGQVDVYIGTQYGGFNAKAPNLIAVPDGNACLPATATPTPSGSVKPTP